MGRRTLDDVIGTPAGVEAILENIHVLRTAKERGAYVLTGSSGKSHFESIMLIDFDNAVQNTRLTARQREVINLVYEQEYSQTEAAKLLGCSQQAVQQHVKAAIKKIAETYNKGGVSIV